MASTRTLSFAFLLCIAALCGGCLTQYSDAYRSECTLVLSVKSDERQLGIAFNDCLHDRGYRVSPSQDGSWYAVRGQKEKVPVPERRLKLAFERDRKQLVVTVWAIETEQYTPRRSVATDNPNALPLTGIENDRRAVIDAILASQSE